MRKRFSTILAVTLCSTWPPAPASSLSDKSFVDLLFKAAEHLGVEAVRHAVDLAIKGKQIDYSRLRADDSMLKELVLRKLAQCARLAKELDDANVSPTISIRDLAASRNPFADKVAAFRADCDDLRAAP
jgi:hypothetical protein